MPHEIPLITTIVAGLGLAFVLGFLAHKFRIPPLVGYLIAGVVVGPYTPGFVADQALAQELAELGIILLMFGVGLHFSLKDLLSVSAIAIPGAIVQIVAATGLGLGLGLLMGWPVGGSLVFGIALSVASTVVLLRAVQERRLIETERGRIAVGWLIVEDLAMVLTLVLLPAVASAMGGHDLGDTPAPWFARFELGVAGVLGLTLANVAAFVTIMLLVGRRIIPWLLHAVAHSGSRELFRLAVLGIALCVAFGAAKLFGVSLALGAFFAGMIMSESELSQRAAQESLPLRDAFSVLFFVAVGMLFNPQTLAGDPLPVIATVLIIVIGKSLAAFLIVRAFRYPTTTALMISASLAQIGEFSFILADLGVRLGLLPGEGRDLVLAGALLSIVLNPVAFRILDWMTPRLERPADDDDHAAAPMPGSPAPEAAPGQAPADRAGHVVLVGFGRVGSLIGDYLVRSGQNFLVVEDSDRLVSLLRERKIEAVHGNAASPDVAARTNLARATHLAVAIPDAFEAGQVVQQARQSNPALVIIARAHSDDEVRHLTDLGADVVIMGEREIARTMIGHLAERRTGASQAESDA